MSVYVCQSVCVCLRSYLRNYTSNLHQCFVLKTHGRGSVFLWGRSDKLGISGYTDDVLLAHKVRLLDVAARLGQRGSHAALRLARRNTRCRQRTLETTPGPTRPQLTRQVATKGAESAVSDCLVSVVVLGRVQQRLDECAVTPKCRPLPLIYALSVTNLSPCID